MKTHFLITLTFLIFGLTATMAGTKEVNNEAMDKSHEAVARMLERRVYYPGFAKNENISGTVVFELRVREDNRIEYRPVEYNDLALSSELERQVRKLEPRLVKMLEPGKSKRFKVNFVLK